MIVPQKRQLDISLEAIDIVKLDLAKNLEWRSNRTAIINLWIIKKCLIIQVITIDIDTTHQSLINEVLPNKNAEQRNHIFQ